MNKIRGIFNWISDRSSLIASTCLITFIVAVAFLSIDIALKNGKLQEENLKLQIDRIELKSQLEKSFLYLNNSQDIIGQQGSIIKTQDSVIKDLFKKLESLRDGRFSARSIAMD